MRFDTDEARRWAALLGAVCGFIVALLEHCS